MKQRLHLCVRALLPLICAYATESVALAQLPDFERLDNVGGSFVRLATFPVRPMVQVGSDLWAVNHHNSTVEKFTGTSTTPTVYDVPWDPVSIAYWQGETSSNGDDEILVVSRGTWAVLGLDYATGEVKWVIQTRPGDPTSTSRIGEMAEPGDIVVDSSLTSPVRHRAFVSCTGADSVIQIDLSVPQIDRIFKETSDSAFQCKSPLFLSLDTSSTPPNVFVSPLISGNNSMWGGTLIAGTKVLDLTDPANLTSSKKRLPDNDLFRITPYTSSSSPGSVAVVARRTGTILFAHGLNPVSGSLWQLNTEANNKDPNLQGEPDVQGKFSFNRITVVPTPLTLDTSEIGLPNSGTVSWTLDPSGMVSGSTIGSGQTVGQPFGLAFTSYGVGFVTGLLTDNVAAISSAGSLVMEWDLPNSANDRAIPRAVLVKSETSSRVGDVLVYAWGQNKIYEYHYNFNTASATNTRTYQLSWDPTPAIVKEGRSLFFDGTRSTFGNLSCASCHIEGGSDMLVWNLSNLPHDGSGGNLPIDDKGGMFTQTLVGLSRVAPFHWRGERRLVDFNTFAFTGLLGASAPLQVTDSTHSYPQNFDKFEAYLMSLTNPANPNENRDRKVDSSVEFFDSLHPLPSSLTTSNAEDGQDKFLGEALFPNNFRCADCHAGPVGTSNDINMEQETGFRPRRSHMKAAPFHELWRKRQSTADVQLAGQTASSPIAFLGAGLSHPGIFRDLFDFVGTITLATSTSSAVQNAADVTSFIHQWDQGLAPSVHFAVLLNSTSPSYVSAELTYLETQALLGNCDIAVFGIIQNSSTPVHTRWHYDRSNGTFVSDHPSVISSRTMSNFTSAASFESNVFIGLPVGMSERFATDYDMDQIPNLQDSGGATTPNSNLSDITAPALSYTGSHPVHWTTSRAARVEFETDEPTTAIVRYWRSGSTKIFEATSSNLSRIHTVMLTELEPSTVVGVPADPVFSPVDMDYDMEIETRDLEGNSSIDSIPATFRSNPFITPFEGAVDPSSGTNTFFQPVGGTSGPTAVVQHRQILHEHVLNSVTVSAAAVTSGVDVTIDCEVDFKRGGDFSGSTFVRPPAGSRVVIGHLLKLGTGGIVTPIDPGAVNNGSTLRVDTVQLVNSSGYTLEVDGASGGPGAPFVLNKNLSSSTTGAVQMTFNVASGLTTGDEVRFVVDAVVEVFDVATSGGTAWADELSDAVSVHPGVIYLPTANPNFQSPFPTPDLGKRRAYVEWSFPDTKEINAFADAPVL